MVADLVQPIKELCMESNKPVEKSSKHFRQVTFTSKNNKSNQLIRQNYDNVGKNKPHP